MCAVSDYVNSVRFLNIMFEVQNVWLFMGNLLKTMW